ncbi:phage major capsid protein [Actinomycetospora endophytica]|uniref:Phage major capsid protein n=1 Tax=Actinomycetospora endophytica TaxID=2291215 RepID=A0ABS8PBN7_9PSEU|nr:phage major capsid protein [Actinomycetospora endophytica]MCD2195696.1 phage major capsid protein [Actinomycetospora endophytica]
MAPTDVTQRAHTGADLPQPIAQEITGLIAEQSVAMQYATKIPVTTQDQVVPILSSAVTAGWLANSDTAYKPVSKPDWTPEHIVMAELATLCVIPDAIVADTDWDIYSSIKDQIAAAFAQKIDAAVFFGIDRPSVWSTPGLVAEATNAGQVITASGDPASYFSEAIQTASTVARTGLSPTQIVTRPGFTLDALAANTSATLAQVNPIADGKPVGMSVAGLPLVDCPNGWDDTQAECVAGDFSKIIIGVRQDISVDSSDSATIVDPSTGQVTFSAWQQDSRVMRAVMRLGVATAKPITNRGVIATPVGVLAPASGTHLSNAKASKTSK